MKNLTQQNALQQSKQNILNGMNKYTNGMEKVPVNSMYGKIGPGAPISAAGTAGVFTETISILGKKFELTSYLNETAKFHLAQVDFHGILFYKSLKNLKIPLHIEEIINYLDSLLQSTERENQLDSILEKIS